MESQTFSHDLRVLLCPQCGGPLDVRPEGGVVTCPFCKVKMLLASRLEKPAAPAEQTKDMGESQRLEMLRAQDGKPYLPPPEIRYLIRGGELSPDQFNQAMQEWQKTRAQLVAEALPAAAERMYFLTLMLYQYYLKIKDDVRRRALLETASELLTDPRHVQDVHCMLARAAATSGDMEAAEKWLSLCDPRSTDLHADSAYRFTSATLATINGRWDEVLKALGENQNDIPISDENDAVCGVLRANAHEHLGRVDQAKTLLRQLAQNPAIPAGTINEIVERYRSLQIVVCEKSYPEIKAQLAAKTRKGRGVIGRVLSILALLIGAGSLSLHWLRLPFVPDTEEFRGGALTVGLILLVWGATGFTVMYVLRALLGGSADREQLLKSGVPAKAEIVGIQPTGWKINNVPQYKLSLQITYAGKEPYQISQKVMMPSNQVQYFQPGVTLGAKVDPKKPKKVALEM
jgi:uncharacterized Zn finger protein (UPF0148 family)